MYSPTYSIDAFLLFPPFSPLFFFSLFLSPLSSLVRAWGSFSLLLHLARCDQYSRGSGCVYVCVVVLYVVEPPFPPPLFSPLPPHKGVGGR